MINGWLLKMRFISVLLTAILFVGGGYSADASQPLAVHFWDVCISVFEVTQDARSDTRNDLAERVSNTVQKSIEEIDTKRRVFALPNCIKGDQPGFERQLTFVMSVKREKIRVNDGDWNLIVVSGLSPNGLFQDREYLPTVILQPEKISDDRIVEALTNFFDRSVTNAIRRLYQK
jgi:hypothetical protein